MLYLKECHHISTYVAFMVYFSNICQSPSPFFYLLQGENKENKGVVLKHHVVMLSLREYVHSASLRRSKVFSQHPWMQIPRNKKTQKTQSMKQVSPTQRLKAFSAAHVSQTKVKAPRSCLVLCKVHSDPQSRPVLCERFSQLSGSLCGQRNLYSNEKGFVPVANELLQGCTHRFTYHHLVKTDNFF